MRKPSTSTQALGGTKESPLAVLGSRGHPHRNPPAKHKACLDAHLAHKAFPPRICLAAKLAACLSGNSRQFSSASPAPDPSLSHLDLHSY